MYFADIEFGEALLVAFQVFFFVIWIWILITILGDLFRDHETRAGRRSSIGRRRSCLFEGGPPGTRRRALFSCKPPGLQAKLQVISNR